MNGRGENVEIKINQTNDLISFTISYEHSYSSDISTSVKINTNCGNKHDETTLVVKNQDFKNLTFRISIHL